jgi:hypothetical protein
VHDAVQFGTRVGLAIQKDAHHNEDKGEVCESEAECLATSPLTTVTCTMPRRVRSVGR